MNKESTESTKNIKWYTQNFKVEWLNDPEFNDWLEQDQNKLKPLVIASKGSRRNLKDKTIFSYLQCIMKYNFHSVLFSCHI